MDFMNQSSMVIDLSPNRVTKESVLKMYKPDKNGYIAINLSLHPGLVVDNRINPDNISSSEK